MIKFSNDLMKMEQIKPQTYTATVDFVKNLAGDYYHGRFQLEDPTQMDFSAGQCVVFLIGPPKLRHILSMASSPKEKNFIEILQSTASMGEGSKWLMNIKAGDSVSFFGPVGRFDMQHDTPRQKVFVAIGCSIAPFRSMLFDYLETGGRAPVVLYWGLRFPSDIFWQDELEKLAGENSQVRCHVTLSKPTDDWTGLRGRVTDHVVQDTKNLSYSEFYLCGKREMIAEVRQQLTDVGVEGKQIFTETFF